MATRWHHLEIDSFAPIRFRICTDCKFGHQEALPASVANWATKWHNLHCLVQNLVIRCHLHCFHSWPLGCVTCIATLPLFVLLALSVVLSWNFHQPESHQLSLNEVLYGETDIRPQIHLGPIKIGSLHCGLPLDPSAHWASIRLAYLMSPWCVRSRMTHKCYIRTNQPADRQPQTSLLDVLIICGTLSFNTKIIFLGNES